MDRAAHTVVETPRFLRDADEAGIDENARGRIVDAVAADPLQGDEVRGSGGVRKIRIAGQGRGKSGGYRVMAIHLGESRPVYLLALLRKGDRENFNAAEVAGMKALVANIKQAWRARR